MGDQHLAPFAEPLQSETPTSAEINDERQGAEEKHHQHYFTHANTRHRVAGRGEEVEQRCGIEREAPILVEHQIEQESESNQHGSKEEPHAATLP